MFGCCEGKSAAVLLNGHIDMPGGVAAVEIEGGRNGKKAAATASLF